MANNYRNYVSDELVYKGRIAEVRRVGLRMDDGQVVSRDLIHCSGAAVVLPVVDDGAIVMIRNVRFVVNELLWELPAGMIDPGEAPELCAARELVEETGFLAGKLQKLGEFYSAPGMSDEKLHAYLATGLTQGAQDLEAYEDIRVETLKPQRVRQMVQSGEIHDGKTIAALALYWLGDGWPRM
jgi:ADP-ribose pyrophosphatase